MINKTQYFSDLKMGKINQGLAIEHLQTHFRKVLEDDKLVVEEFRNTNSVFDYRIRTHNILIELKSRRNNINKYPTQMIGHNKVSYGRTKMKTENQRVFFSFMLEEKNDKTKKELYLLEDNSDTIYKTKMCGNYARGDKTDKLCLINNNLLELISIF